MSDLAPERVRDAIDRAREVTETCENPGPCFGCDERNAHLATLTQTINRHTPFEDAIGMMQCQHCSSDHYSYMPWPCPDVKTAANALTEMGAL